MKPPKITENKVENDSQAYLDQVSDLEEHGNPRDTRRKPRKEDNSIPDYARRTPGERDRDRILYSSALRRLSGITQVVKAGENDVYHNRLTHTLEVAQVGRRMAQYAQKRIRAADGLLGSASTCDPEVVEAACLAHDLGHPPFGHVAEEALDRLAKDKGNDDGFEGNAQSFRIVTRLSRYSKDDGYGLNLSRATLNAILKYPWLRDISSSNKKKSDKFGAYREDVEAFGFARGAMPEDIQSFEAQIMDAADAIAYAVHDLSDFYKTGILNFYKIKRFRGKNSEFDLHFERNKNVLLIGQYADNPEEAKEFLRNKILRFLKDEVYDFGKMSEISQISRDSGLISYLINSSLDVEYKNGLQNLIIPDDITITINFLKSIIWDGVIMRPQLATQQKGQIRIIETLFDFYYTALQDREYRMLPEEYSDEIKSGELKILDNASRVRLVVDLVSRLSEAQAYRMYNRIIGADSGSIAEHV